MTILAAFAEDEPERVPAFFIIEPAERYHARRQELLTSHGLADFRRCPLLYHQKVTGQISDEDRPAYLLGRAAHSLILEGRGAFERDFAVGGPVNPATGKPYGTRTKAFAEWAAAQGKPVLNDEQLALVEAMAASVRGHEQARRLLAKGIPEGVLRCAYCEVPSQARIDWFNPVCGIVDLKTCDKLDWLEADARSYGYVHQLAFYRALLAELSGRVFPVYLIAVEKRPPYRCGVWRVGEEVLGIAQQDNEQAIDRLRDCLAHGVWPTGYEDLRGFDHL